MQIGKMQPAAAIALLQDSSLGRLGCVVNGRPYVVPVYYYFDGKDIFIHSLPGLKIEALRANPSACLQVDEIRDAYHWRSVIATGHYEEVAQSDAEHDLILARLFQRLPHLSPAESQIEARNGKVIIFRLKVEELTGVGEEW
jgi:uncharacterized protein